MDVYPQHLELQQVQVLLRHGERTPVNTRFQNTGLNPRWPYCSAARAMRSVVLNEQGLLDTLSWHRKLERLGRDDSPVASSGPKGEQESICKPGELTDKGRETTLALGQRLRKLYVEQLGLLPAWMDDEARSSIKLRATPIQRALDSVQQTFVGLYPSNQRSPGLLPPTITQRLMEDEVLYPNESACKRFAELSHAFADRTAQLWNDSAEMKYLNKKLSKWMPKETPTVRVDGHPRLSGIFDTSNATLAHGPNTRLPSEFYDPQVRIHTDRICTEEWFVGYQESAEYRKLGIGALIGDLTQHMVEHVNNSNQKANAKSTDKVRTDSDTASFKLSLAGCHDTTIASTLTALGAFRVDRDSWPPFTSTIVFELFRAKTPAKSTVQSADSPSTTMWPSTQKSWWFSLFASPSPSDPQVQARDRWETLSDAKRESLNDYFVRIRYNDKSVSLPFCKPAGRHLEGDESFCTLAAFKQAADMITPKDWRAECRANLGTSAFPPRIEHPPGVKVDEV